MSFIVDWIWSFWTPSPDLPPEWIAALSLTQPQSTDEPCPTRVLFRRQVEHVDQPALEPSLRSSILQQLVKLEWPRWVSCMEVIIKKRYLGVVLTMNANCVGSIRQRLTILGPQLTAIYQRQQRDLAQLADVNINQITSLATLVSQDRLTASSAVDLAMSWYHCLQSILCTILGTSLTKSEQGSLSLALVPSLDLLVQLWVDRVKLHPKLLVDKPVEKPSRPISFDIEQLPTLTKEEMNRRRDVLSKLLFKCPSPSVTPSSPSKTR